MERLEQTAINEGLTETKLEMQGVSGKDRSPAILKAYNEKGVGFEIPYLTMEDTDWA